MSLSWPGNLASTTSSSISRERREAAFGRGLVTGIRLALAAVVAVLSLALPALAQEFDTKAKFAVLMDYESGTLLFHKAGDEPLEPASMAKLMTIAVVFDELQQKRLTLDDEFF